MRLLVNLLQRAQVPLTISCPYIVGHKELTSSRNRFLSLAIWEIKVRSLLEKSMISILSVCLQFSTELASR